MISLWIAACLALWFAIGYATYRLALSNADEEEIDDVNEGRTVFTCLGPIPIVVVGILCLVQYVEEKMTKHER